MDGRVLNAPGMKKHETHRQYVLRLSEGKGCGEAELKPYLVKLQAGKMAPSQAVAYGSERGYVFGERTARYWKMGDRVGLEHHRPFSLDKMSIENVRSYVQSVNKRTSYAVPKEAALKLIKKELKVTYVRRHHSLDGFEEKEVTEELYGRIMKEAGLHVRANPQQDAVGRQEQGRSPMAIGGGFLKNFTEPQRNSIVSYLLTYENKLSLKVCFLFVFVSQ